MKLWRLEGVMARDVVPERLYANGAPHKERVRHVHRAMFRVFRYVLVDR